MTWKVLILIEEAWFEPAMTFPLGLREWTFLRASLYFQGSHRKALQIERKYTSKSISSWALNKISSSDRDNNSGKNTALPGKEMLDFGLAFCLMRKICHDPFSPFNCDDELWSRDHFPARWKNRGVREREWASPSEYFFRGSPADADSDPAPHDCNFVIRSSVELALKLWEYNQCCEIAQKMLC